MSAGSEPIKPTARELLARRLQQLRDAEIALERDVERTSVGLPYEGNMVLYNAYRGAWDRVQAERADIFNMLEDCA